MACSTDTDNKRLMVSDGTLSNVLFIVVDTLRADYLSIYGGESATPNIDTLAASGVRFERAYSHAPIIGPSHSSMFTSLLPRVHGVRNHFQVLNDEHVTLAEILKRNHWNTAAFVSLGVLKARVGLSQGFNEYHDSFGLDWWKTSDQLNNEILPWISRQKEPFFLWVHYSDPHEPYAPVDRIYPQLLIKQAGVENLTTTIEADANTKSIPLVVPPGRTVIKVSTVGVPLHRPIRLQGIRTTDSQVEAECVSGCESAKNIKNPETFSATVVINNLNDKKTNTNLILRADEVLTLQELRRRYQEEVEYSDRQIGFLLDSLHSTEKLDETLIILTADHGEGLGNHGTMGHVSQLYDEQLRVPLILSWPGHLPANKVVKTPVSLIDLLLTITDLINLSDDFERGGRTLVPLMLGSAVHDVTPSIIAETFSPRAPRERRALITDDYKLIVAPAQNRTELYDLIDDPEELQNEKGRPRVLAELREELRSNLSNLKARKPDERPTSEDQLRQLRSLGYIR